MKRSLALFSIAAVLPLVVVGVGMGAWSLRSQRTVIEERAAGHANFVATVLGQEFSAIQHAARMITQSPALDGPLDEQRLRILGSRFIADDPGWRAISISDLGGVRVLDVPNPVGGRAGGEVVDRESHRAAVEGRQGAVGDVVRGSRGNLAFAVRAPAIRDGEVRYVVSVVVDPKVLEPLLLQQNLPRGWTVEIVDGQGSIVARSDGARLGERADRAGLAARASGRPGFYRNEADGERDEVLTWQAIPGADWTVHVAIPASAYYAPASQALGVLVAGAVVSLALSAMLGWLLWREMVLHRRRESQALERQRLEALGQMTGGVAHDVNNLLTPILGGLDLLRPRVEGDERAVRLVEAAIAGAERARSLVSRLLSFARRQALETRDIDVAALLSGLAELLERSVGPKVRLVMRTAGSIPTAKVDPSQLELAVLNLAVNARDAMEGGGTLTIEAAEAKLERPADGLPAGRYVRICVSDTGVGMDAATLQRAVEPFFTTKAHGKGTGLGLSMVHGLAAQSGGSLRLYSKPGEGTRAEIWLPSGQEAPAPAPAPEELNSDRTGRLLLVDDDELVRGSTAAVLRDHGHEVLEARSAGEAMALLERGGIDVLVTDYAMPGKNGDVLIREARGLRPGLPALLITGFASFTDPLPEGVIRLAKPYRRVELLNRVARLLPARQTA